MKIEILKDYFNLKKGEKYSNINPIYAEKLIKLKVAKAVK